MNKWFCWHKWSEWSKLIVTYNNVRQFRYCYKCNKVIHRRAACGNDVNVGLWNTPTTEKEVE